MSNRMSEKELRQLERLSDAIELPAQTTRALINEVRRLRTVLAEYADKHNWMYDGYNTSCVWMPCEHGYTRAENALKDGE